MLTMVENNLDLSTTWSKYGTACT